jgi:hypothetical protein
VALKTTAPPARLALPVGRSVCGGNGRCPGIVRELLRDARICRGGAPSYAVAWPDQPSVVSSEAAGGV